MAYTLIPVIRTYLNGATPRTGTVRLQLVGPLYNEGEIADRQPQIATLDAAGSISLIVRATNDPATLPVGGGAYEVTETLSGLATSVYYIEAPYNGGPVDLATAPHLTARDINAPSVLFQPVNERGLPGGYPVLDGSGRVPRDQLPADLGGGGGGGGGVEISGQATDIQPLGSRAAGSTGKAADASHVHETPSLNQLKPPTAAVGFGGQRLTNLADGEQPQDAATVAQLGQSVLGMINVKDRAYGAKGDGAADDTAALQAALNACQPGGVVYIPQGVYRLSAPVSLPPGVTVRGSHANMMTAAGLTDPPCYLQPLPGFTGAALLVLKDQEGGAYAAIPAEHRVESLMIDGSVLDGARPVDGIYAEGNIQNVRLTDVTIRRMSNNGIVTAGKANVFPYSWRMQNVMVDNCRANGLLLTRLTDLTMLDCQVIGSWGHGMVLDNIANGLMIGCRSEWNGNHGIRLTGAWGNGTGSGGMLMSACTTDRNGWDGVRIDATGSAPITISGLMTRRDGRNGGNGGGNYAGLAIAAATAPVLADAVTCYPGTDDDGTGTASPQYGVYLTGASNVQIGSGYLHAVEDGLKDSTVGGSVAVGAEVTTLTGPTTTKADRLRRYTRETNVTINDLLGEKPFFIAHRGSGMEYPEHTMAAYESAVAGGAKAIEVSVNLTADGVLVCMHDQTLERTTNGTGSISNWTYQALRNKVRTNLRPLLGDGWVEQQIPTLREVLDRFLGRVVIFLEAKSNPSVPIVQKLITDFYPHAYRSLVWKGHYQGTSFPWAKAHNMTTWAYLDPNTTEAQMDAISTQPDMWGVPHTMTDTRIQQVVARGKPVICWEVHRRSDVTRLTGLGVQGMMCAQLQYVRGTAPLGPADDWSTSVKAPGDMGTVLYTNNRALKYKGDGSVYFEMTGAAALIGSRSRPIFPASGYRITFKMLYEGLPPATEHAGIVFGKVADDPYQFTVANPTGGYHVVMRASGQMQVYKHVAGSTTGTQLGTTNTAAVVAGQWMSFQVDVTPTQVILTRTDVTPAVTVTVDDTEFRGGYVHLSAGTIGSIANRPNWRELTVTPL
ncbi:glycerophosphodiester phosphodiesterase family protein [Streptomyces sp. NBC_01242]|uniref:glycerophosphodiester phosphodiesterase family protein n=1 Tax=Streptomyces sp. NBC_01242 TaxID=2903795 RepID=UPI002257950F|nr:glycerophosphodiester phosphodiesterase family protein [Streptomyces sp. NBC_01242]MCX4799581.1 glycerophosphodiester phosphodiesterase family protein [Streptomyces sp. NBC_01242]